MVDGFKQVSSTQSKASQVYPEYTAWKTSPGPDTLTPLIEKLDPTINSALRSYGLDTDPMMKNAARVHVSKVLGNYDPKKPASLDTFVRGELQRLQRINARRRSPIPVPEGALADIKSINTDESELEFELGRQPTVQELADKTGLSMKRISTLRMKYKPVVTDMSGTHRAEDDSLFLLASQNFDQNKYAIDMAYYDSDNIDKKIMEWSMGLYGTAPKAKKEQAAKLGISVPAVTKRSASIAARVEAHRINSSV